MRKNRKAVTLLDDPVNSMAQQLIQKGLISALQATVIVEDHKYAYLEDDNGFADARRYADLKNNGARVLGPEEVLGLMVGHMKSVVAKLEDS